MLNTLIASTDNPEHLARLLEALNLIDKRCLFGILDNSGERIVQLQYATIADVAVLMKLHNLNLSETELTNK
ncbi:MAG TPA: hypothetical protein PKM21_14520 [Anaerolineales bacterium]|nr:hypothetical protein [Anaerolineales bacterium]